MRIVGIISRRRWLPTDRLPAYDGRVALMKKKLLRSAAIKQARHAHMTWRHEKMGPREYSEQWNLPVCALNALKVLGLVFIVNFFYCAFKDYKGIPNEEMGDVL